MDWLRPLYAQVYQTLQSALPEYWPEFTSLFEPQPEDRFSPVTMLPLAMCEAVGGSAAEAVPVAAAIVAAERSLRVADDLADRDRPNRLWEQVGSARAWNYASALQTLCFGILSASAYDPELILRIQRLFVDTFFCIGAGQDRDLSRVPKTVGEYWSTIELKTAIAYSATCGAGAMVGTEDIRLIEACGAFGHHLGLGIQVFNDMESIWQPEGKTDLQQGKVTLPVIYALETNHPAREELAALVNASQLATCADRVKQILDDVDTRSFLVWAALKERDQALDALAALPKTRARDGLSAYLTGMFGDIDSLLVS
jgi:geranylgeranyl diphosphate synthase type I